VSLLILGTHSHLSVGPIQKLTVPDFQHISNQYEKMQNEVMQKPAKER
jgi:hypothetical protein